MTNVKSLKKAAAAILAAVLCLSAVLFSGFHNVIPDMALQAEAAAAAEAVTDFLNSGFNNSNVTIYDGTAKNKTFNMMGNTFTQGLQFDDENSPYYGSISFNVENINSISFTLGHIDDTNLRNGTITIYKDNAWDSEIYCTATANNTFYRIDTSDTETIKFNFSEDGGNGYSYAYFGFGNIVLNDDFSAISTETDKNIGITPTDFLNSGYNNYNVTIYDGTAANKTFKMMGRTFTQGLQFDDENSPYYGTISFNVENINSISFTLGHIDDTNLRNAKINIYKNNAWAQEIYCTSTENNTSYRIDTSNAETIRFDFSEDGGNGYSYAYFGLSNIVLNDNTSTITDDYDMNIDITDKDFLNAGYNNYNVNIYDGTAANKTFKMTGKTFAQGLKLHDENSPYYGTISYNVENIDSLTFILGHIDDTSLNNAKLTIYKDNNWFYELYCDSSMNRKAYTFNTSDADTIRFVLSEDGGNGYSHTYFGMANIVLNNDFSNITDGSYSDRSKIVSIDALIEEEKAAEAAKEKIGDTNEDGTVDSSDASKVLAAYANKATGGELGLTETQVLNADVNMDGAVDSSDASSILGFYAYSATGGEGTMAEYMGV